MKKKIILFSFEEATVNLTPLLDVLFLILVFFILSASFLHLDTISLSSAPPLSSSAASVTHSIYIYIHKDASIIFDNSPLFSFEELKYHLEHYHKKEPQGTPKLYIDQETPFWVYQKVKTLIESTGFTQLDIVLHYE